MANFAEGFDSWDSNYFESHILLNSLQMGTIGSINFNSISRGIVNKIRRSLPTRLLLFLDRNTSPIRVEPYLKIQYEAKWYNLTTVASRTLILVIKTLLNKIAVYDPAVRFNISPSNFINIRSTWQNLWLIKNLILNLK